MALCGLFLKHLRRFSHLGNDLHIKGAALHAYPAFDASRCLDRKSSIPFLDLLDPLRRYLVHVPDDPADLNALWTRKTVLAVVDKNDTSARFS